jgi:hypothetical protein
MTNLKVFSPEHLIRDAEESGFFQCQECGLVWFGRADIEECPSGLQHGMPVHVVVLCRRCDKVVPIEDFENHLGRKHKVA